MEAGGKQGQLCPLTQAPEAAAPSGEGHGLGPLVRVSGEGVGCEELQGEKLLEQPASL